MMLSIIIPVYNSEKYLPQCLESVFSQDLDPADYEVIVINDGSTDHSKDIISEFQKKHSNLILINQANQGVSVARNAGIETAKGEYILFVDADDLLFSNSVSGACQYAVSSNLDLLYVKISYINADGEITGEFVMDSDEIKIEDGFKHQRRGYIFAFYKRKVIGDLRFVPDVPIAEDALFNLFIHAKAKRISYFDRSLYQYRKTPNSALNSDLSKSERAFKGYLTIINEITRYVGTEEKKLSGIQRQYFARPVFVTAKMAISANIIPNRSKSRYTELVKVLQEMGNRGVIENLKKTHPFFGANWFLFIGYQKLRHYKSALQWKLFKSQ